MSDKRIVFTRPDGGVSIIIPAPGIDLARAMQDVPADAADVQVVDAAEVPNDRTFRSAWKLEGKACIECPTRSRAIAHQIRRAKREAEFKPFDDVIAKRLPGEAEAEAVRAAIRAKYSAMQELIDSCEDTQALRAALGT